MKKIYALLLPLAMCCLLGACTEEKTEVIDDPEVAESLVGLWYGESVDGVRHLMDLRANRTGVYSAYHLMFNSPSTTPLPEWTAGGGLFEAEGFLEPCGLGWLQLRDGTSLEYYDLHRIYTPSADRCSVDMTNLAGRIWTGYYEKKVITLEFRADGTMTRTDSPNAGWDFETTTQTSEWSVTDNVLHFGSFPTAWGVTVEEDARHGDVIFVDFGDAASVFVEE